MPALSRSEIEKIAHLARIELTPAETERYAAQLEKIVEYVGRLSAVDIEGVEPFLNAAAEGNVWRPDQARPGLAREAALANAPKQTDGFFRVPKVT